LLRKPAKELARSVGGVSREALGLQTKPLLCALDHDGGRSHFVEGPGRRRFDIDDEGVLVIDQIVEP